MTKLINLNLSLLYSTTLYRIMKYYTEQIFKKKRMTTIKITFKNKTTFLTYL